MNIVKFAWIFWTFILSLFIMVLFSVFLFIRHMAKPIEKQPDMYELMLRKE